MGTRKELTAAVKQEALRLGFSLVGVTTADPPRHMDFYRRWTAQGYHGSMAWMATERALDRRADPQKILPGCQTILVLGADYPFLEHSNSGGKIAAYAGNLDYHDVLGERLKQLAAFLASRIDRPLSHRWYTDTGPILERELAVRAGLGWIGKNTTLIHPRKGSYFFLAEMFLDLELEVDDPFSGELCGSCTRCLEACPTGCIEEPYLLNASRCISYLTIEYRELLPEELRPLMGEWVFGCDVCQQVCPWNQRFGRGRKILNEFQPREDVLAPNLQEELTLTQQEFRNKFKGSPIKRTKRRGYLRNAAVALGNRKAEGAVPALATALEDEEALIRAHAAWALGRIGGEKARTALQRRLNLERDAEVNQEIITALGEINC